MVPFDRKSILVQVLGVKLNVVRPYPRAGAVGRIVGNRLDSLIEIADPVGGNDVIRKPLPKAIRVCRQRIVDMDGVSIRIY